MLEGCWFEFFLKILCFFFVFLAHHIFSPESRDVILGLLITVVMIIAFLLIGVMIAEVKEI